MGDRAELAARVSALEEQVKPLTTGLNGLIEVVEGLVAAERKRVMKQAAVDRLFNGEPLDEIQDEILGQIAGEIDRLLIEHLTAH